MKVNPIYASGLLMVLAGIVIKITALILDTPNSLYAGMGFTVAGIGMIGYSIYKDRKITVS